MASLTTPCRGLVFAAPTYNTTLFPLMGALLEHLGTLKLANRYVGLAGTYAWGKASVTKMLEFARSSNLEVLSPTIDVHCSPSSEDMQACEQLGREMARAILGKS